MSIVKNIQTQLDYGQYLAGVFITKIKKCVDV